ADGSYTLGPLVPGDYRVRFEPEFASAYLAEYYDDHHGAQSGADVITVEKAQTLVGIDAELDIGGAVSGRVTGLDGRSAPGVQVILTSTADPAMTLHASTGAAGTWSTQQAPAGDYTVEF